MIRKPLHLRQSNAYVTEFHRHHSKVSTHKFSLGAYDDQDKLIGVVIVGRPVARMLDDCMTAEVNRLCTDGTPNACSFLYGAAAQVAKAMGYRSIITYILASEPGTTLKAAGWINEGKAGGGTWDRPSRPHVDKHPLEPKTRWRRILN